MNLDKETGISIMKIVEELDSGPVSNIYKFKLDNNRHSHKYYRYINEIPTLLLILIIFVVIFKPI